MNRGRLALIRLNKATAIDTHQIDLHQQQLHSVLDRNKQTCAGVSEIPRTYSSEPYHIQLLGKQAHVDGTPKSLASGHVKSTLFTSACTNDSETVSVMRSALGNVADPTIQNEKRTCMYVNSHHTPTPLLHFCVVRCADNAAICQRLTGDDTPQPHPALLGG